MISHMWLENLAAYSLQVFVLILAGTLLLHLFRLKTPAVLLAFWQSLMVFCLLLPVLQPWRQVRQAFRSAAAPVFEIASPPQPSSLDALPLVTDPAPQRSIPFPTRRTIALILGTGIGLRLLWLAVGLLRLRRYRQRSLRFRVLPQLIRDLQRRVGVAPEILLSEQIDSPVTFGWRRPAVLLPEAFSAMSETLQRPIVCHEMLHIERHDWLYILSEEFLRSLLWFHPAVWWALSRIHLSREQVVDREVLRITGARGPYLESLLQIASLRGRPAAVPAPLLLHERHLVQRVALMLKESSMSKFRVTVSLAAVCVCLLAAGTLAAAWFPLSAPSAPQAAPLVTPAAPVPAPASAKSPADSRTRPSAMKQPSMPSSRQEDPALEAQQRDPLQVEAGIMESKLVKKVEPAYPQLAVRARVEGIVRLQVQVNEQGEVSAVKIIGGHPLLQLAAYEAVKQWRYAPTLLNGEPVPVLTTVNVTFRLTGQASSAPPPPPADPGRRDPIRVGGPIQQGKLIHKVDPDYPEVARQARIQTTILLEVVVNGQGEVTNVKVLRGHPALDQAAIDAVKQWRYSPTLLNGEAVPVITTVSVAFALSDNTGFAVLADQARPAVASQIAGREPMRVGGNVQESKLIHRVEPEYPELARRARIEATVILEVLVNEQGEVANVRVLRSHPLLEQAAVEAVKQWRYSPTYINGVAVPVITTQTVVFRMGGGSGSEVRIVIDQDGSLKDLAGKPITREGLGDKRIILQIPPHSKASFAQINQTLHNLQEQGIQDLRLAATGYRFTGGRLFYVVGGPSNSPFPRPVAAGAGTSVQPAQLDIDLENLAAVAKRSFESPEGSTATLGYTVYVTETGQIVAVDGGLAQLPEVTAALRQARVIAPGRIGNEPVPTAVVVTLSIKW